MFNALVYTKRLEAVGFTREQAEVNVQMITEIMETNLASKQNVKDLRTDFENKIVQLEYRLVIKLGTIVSLSLAAMATLVKFF